MHRERITEAIRVMTDVVEKSRPFDIAQWFADFRDPLNCGTSACLAGWLTRDPYFQALGFVVNKKEWSAYPIYRATPHPATEYSALASVFEISYNEATWIASPSHYPNDEFTTPSEVLERLKSLIDE